MITFGNAALLEAPYRVAFDWDAGMDDRRFMAMEDAIANTLASRTDQLVFVSGSSYLRHASSVAAKRHAASRIVVTPTITLGGRVCAYNQQDGTRSYIDTAREPAPFGVRPLRPTLSRAVPAWVNLEVPDAGSWHSGWRTSESSSPTTTAATSAPSRLE